MGIIKNKSELATNDLRRDALDILESGLEAVDTEKVLRRKLKVTDGILNIDGGGRIDLRTLGKIVFVGIGKCSLDGAKVLEEILGEYLTEGIALDVKSPSAKATEGLIKIRYFQGDHPLPSERNIEATKNILEMVKGLSENDLILTLISGGGSSLFEFPIEGVSLEDIINKTKELTAKGADIYELNAARKEMSQVKGGKFAEICHPAQMLNLIFSDVLGNDLSVIASGPTVLNEDSDDVKNILLLSNRDALLAMKSKAEELGYGTKIETEDLSGNAAKVGREIARKDIKPKTCSLFGGETTVELAVDHGIGGRNQELALSALINIKDNILIISSSSDGCDNTDHAGALSDKEMFEKSKSLGLSAEEFLQKSDSYNFWKLCAGALYTGRLGSNVADLVIIISN